MSEPTPLPFTAALALADCASRVILEYRPRPDDNHRRSSIILRDPGVHALRYLWKTGDENQRFTVACRLHVWLHGNAERGRRAMERQQAKKKAATV